MIIQLITVREIADKDLDIWLRMFREDCGYRFDQEKLKTEKMASWSDEKPELRTKATTTIILVNDEECPV